MLYQPFLWETVLAPPPSSCDATLQIPRLSKRVTRWLYCIAEQCAKRRFVHNTEGGNWNKRNSPIITRLMHEIRGPLPGAQNPYLIARYLCCCCCCCSFLLLLLLLHLTLLTLSHHHKHLKASDSALLYSCQREERRSIQYCSAAGTPRYSNV